MLSAAHRICIAILLLGFSSFAAHAQSGDPCRRPSAGSVVMPPAELSSQGGVLEVEFTYYTTIDEAGRTIFCFVTRDGLESPTLHVQPGDVLNITLTNLLPVPPPGSPTEVVAGAAQRCGDVTMTISSVNLHFHGTNTSPTCHSDDVIHTIVNAGESFQYSVAIPLDEPPGLYWYHPHIHSLAEAAVQGGATGAIIVGGIENAQPAVRGLPERVLIFRDQNVAGNPTPGGAIPSWDLSLNYVPISYVPSTSGYIPSILKMRRGQREFWRVANTAADTILDLQILYDGIAQPVSIVGFDGVPVSSEDDQRRAALLTQTHLLLPPGGRAEFIVQGPSAGVRRGILRTRNIDTGPDGDNDPERTLAVLEGTESGPTLPVEVPSGLPAVIARRFERLDESQPTVKRRLYFSEVLSDPSNPLSATNFFITVDGATPRLFDANDPPAITTHQGAVEDWTIENRSLELHEFHIHQIHFQLLAVNGIPVPAEQRQFFDTYQVPYWSGQGAYPSITVRMDFRGADVGDFVYHCHILGHEDNGMMAILRVLAHP